MASETCTPPPSPTLPNRTIFNMTSKSPDLLPLQFLRIPLFARQKTHTHTYRHAAAANVSVSLPSRSKTPIYPLDSSRLGPVHRQEQRPMAGVAWACLGPIGWFARSGFPPRTVLSPLLRVPLHLYFSFCSLHILPYISPPPLCIPFSPSFPYPLLS